MQQGRCALGITPSESSETEHPGTGYMKQISYFWVDREEQPTPRTRCQPVPPSPESRWVDGLAFAHAPLALKVTDPKKQPTMGFLSQGRVTHWRKCSQAPSL